ncbi:MAG: protease complex subunit PrcB family protein [Firmicutes bacterium]|nr:protease complex subunit PrcB family protein [Bacillota bacterium]
MIHMQRVTLHDVPPFDLPAYLVFTSSREMAAVYGRDVGSKLDLEENILVAAHRGLCRTGGYTIRIESVQAAEREVIVRLSLTDPRPGDFVTMVMTYPRDMVLIQKSTLPSRGDLIFKFVGPGGIVMAQKRVSL